jgi:hypothetical protein
MHQHNIRIYSLVCVSRSLKQGDALSPFIFKFSFEYSIRKVQENEVVLKLDGTYQLLVYGDDVNLLGYKIDNIKKYTKTLIDASKEVGLKAKADKTMYCIC